MPEAYSERFDIDVTLNNGEPWINSGDITVTSPTGAVYLSHVAMETTGITIENTDTNYDNPVRMDWETRDSELSRNISNVKVAESPQVTASSTETVYLNGVSAIGEYVQSGMDMVMSPDGSDRLDSAESQTYTLSIHLLGRRVL